jgi:diguanylate cyclase (GGDEF)-like protein/PAS domain S-box-containing protein
MSRDTSDDSGRDDAASFASPTGGIVTALFEAAPVPLMLLDRDLGTLAFNEAFAAITGDVGTDPLGRSLASYLSSPGEEELREMVERRERVSLPVTLANPDGDVVGRLELFPAPGREGAPSGYFVARFIENRIATGGGGVEAKAEEFARVSELLAYNRRLVEQSPLGAWVVDFVEIETAHEGNDQVSRCVRTLGFKPIIRQVNARMRQLLGYDDDELSGRSLFDPSVVDAHNAAIVVEQLARHRGGGRSSYELALLRRNKTSAPLMMEASPSRIDQATGLVTQSLAMVVDLTERKAFERQLRDGVISQEILNDLLRISLTDEPLERQLGHALQTILTAPSLGGAGKGCVFIADESGDKLILKTAIGMPPQLARACGEIPFGECLCGKGLVDGEVVFASASATGSPFRFDYPVAYGHYVVPIKAGSKVLGVLTLYVEEGHLYRESEETFLHAVAAALTGLLTHSRTLDELREARNRLEEKIVERTTELRDSNRALSRQISETEAAQERAAQSERQMRSIIENMQEIFYRTDREGGILWASGAVVEILGYAADELLGVPFASLCVDPKEHATFVGALERREGRVKDYQLRLRRKEGGAVWIAINAQYYRNEGGEPQGFEGTARDITDRKKDEERLQLASLVFESAVEGVVVTDADAVIQYVNPAFTTITGYAAEEAVGQTPSILRSDRQNDAFYRAMWGSLLTTGQWRGEIWNRKKSGEAYPEWLTITAIRDEKGNTIQYASIFHDITELKRTEEQVKYLAYHDALTNLPNRTLALDRLSVALGHARRKDSRVAVMFLDLDHFKRINDSLGHTVGDLFLQEVARRLTGSLRGDDTVGRVGGDEFIILIEEVESVDGVVAVARKIIDAMKAPFVHEGRDLYSGVSVGVTFFPDDGKDAESLVRNADMAMYRAKEKGRNNYQLFTNEMDAIAVRRLELESNLRAAVEAGEFQLYYQPKITMVDKNVSGCEALIRWVRPDGKIISPIDFIPVAEETGLIIPIGEFVLKEACRQAQQWREETGFAADFSVAVNLSARQFEQSNLVSVIVNALEATGLPASALCLEITESALMQDIEAAIKTVMELRGMGILIAMDDFGTGYSSLSFLRQMPIHLLKIDKSFVADMTHSASAAAIADAIITLGHSLALSIVAEGVETAEHFSMLKELGCDEMQGYLVSRPLPADEFVAFYKGYRRVR